MGVALLLVGAAASYGVAGQLPGATAAAAPPAGGCWSYLPSAPALDSPPLTDVSTDLEDWTSDSDGEVRLETTGATVVGGTRTVTATISNGPVVSATDAVSGTASFVVSVDGQQLAEPLTTTFEAEAGEGVEEVVASRSIPVGATGSHSLRLDAVYFDVPGDVPAESLRVVCNGQTAGDPSPAGPNPATDPLPTDRTASYAAVAAASVAITAIADQAVLTAARPGDVATVRLQGLASSASATLQLCNAAGEACLPVRSVMTAADGTATTDFMVPAGAPAGMLKVGDGTTTASTPLTVLGVQMVAAAEELDAETTVVTLTGTGWDPTRAVTIRGYAGTASSSAVTGDPEVKADVDAAGEFTAEFVVADQDTQSVIVDQARSSTHIGAVYLISGVIGHGVVDPGDDDPGDDPDEGDDGGETGGEDSGTDSGTGTDTGTSGTPTTGTPVTPPADIPLPGPLPIEVPPGDVPTTVAEAELSVSEVRIDGEGTFSELFGGAPQRDLVFLVENVGSSDVSSPIVRVSVGRSEDIEPQVVAADVGDLGPGEQTVVTVPLELPMAAFGTYHVVGQVGDTDAGAFAVEWTTYPWGLFVLNALALALLALGVRHRLNLRRKSAAAALALPDGDAVVDLQAATAWWAYRSGAGPRPRPRAVPMAASEPMVLPAPAPEPALVEAVIDLDAAEEWWARRDGSQAS